MKTIYNLILFLVLSLTSYSQWVEMSTGFNTYWYCTHFTSRDTGYAAGNNYIVKTTNFGITWTVSKYDSFMRIRDIKFFNSSTGIAIGRDGLIYKTTNSGLNWVQKNNSGVGQDMLALCLVNENTIMICGGFETILRSVDKGENWTAINSGTGQHYYSVSFPSISTGYIAGDAGKIIKSTNGGINWTILNYGGTIPLREIYFINNNTGWASGENGTILITTNTGQTWNPQTTNSPLTCFHQVYFINNQKGWAIGDFGTILSTTNTGNVWIRQNTTVSSTLVMMSFTSELYGMVVGWESTILKTTNGGIIAVESIGSNVPKEYDLFQNYPNPFNPSTKINFDVPELCFINISIYDIQGKKVDEVLYENLSAGSYSTQWNAEKFTSGIYFCRINTGKFSKTVKMTLLK